MNPADFTSSLSLPAPPDHFGFPLQALWWISNNNWQRAHDIVDAEVGADAAWIHGFLHLIEGDEANAAFWYARAGRDVPNQGIRKERDALMAYFLN